MTRVWGGAVSSSSNAGVRTSRVECREKRCMREAEEEKSKDRKEREEKKNRNSERSSTVISIWSRPSNNSLL